MAELKEQDVPAKDRMGKAQASWKDITDKERDIYTLKSEESKKEAAARAVEIEKKGYYTMEDGSKSTDAENAKFFKAPKVRKAKKNDSDDSSSEDEGEKKNPGPKRPPSDWNLYFMEQSKLLQAAGEKAKDCMTLASAKYKEMTEEEKKPYVDSAAEKKEVYKK